MKSTFLSTLLAFLVINCKAQYWQSAEMLGTEGRAGVHHTDGRGNIYLTFAGSANINCGCAPINGLLKLDKNGKPLWCRGMNLSLHHYSAVDDRGNAIIGGQCGYPITEICTSNGTIALPTPGANDASAFAVYDASGNVKWAKALSWPNGDCRITAFAIDTGQNYIVAGTVGQRQSPYLQRYYLHKYDSSGTLLWRDTSYWDCPAGANAITTDKAGSIYMTGGASGTNIAFRQTPLPPLTHSSGFIVKYTASGDVVWAKPYQNKVMRPASIITDSQGHFYVCGSFVPPLNYDGVYLQGIQPNRQAYVAKHDTDGSLVWVHEFNAAGAGALVCDSASNIGFCGALWDARNSFSPDFTKDGQVQLPSNTYGPSAFVAKTDKDGQLLWAISSTQPGPGIASAAGISIHQDGQYFVTGNFDRTVRLGSTVITGGPGPYGNSFQYVFIAKTSTSETTGVRKLENGQLSLFPDPATEVIHVKLPGEWCDILITDVLGREIERFRTSSVEIALNCSHYPSGIYILSAFNNGTARNIKWVKD